jgi:hypothetical protein
MGESWSSRPSKGSRKCTFGEYRSEEGTRIFAAHPPRAFNMDGHLQLLLRDFSRVCFQEAMQEDDWQRLY